MLKVPLDGTFIMNKSVIVKFRVTNKFPHMLPSLPHGFKTWDPKTETRKEPTTRSTKQRFFPRCSLFGITNLNVIP